jgi:hypothetical protein
MSSGLGRTSYLEICRAHETEHTRGIEVRLGDLQWQDLNVFQLLVNSSPVVQIAGSDEGSISDTERTPRKSLTRPEPLLLLYLDRHGP